MTAEQLEGLANGYHMGLDSEEALTHLARRVIAAEKLAEAVGDWVNMKPLCDAELIQAYRAYREACK